MRFGTQVLIAALVAGVALMGVACNKEPGPAGTAGGGGGTSGPRTKITIGMVAKSQSNPVFQAAHQGARDAAKKLADKYNVDITLNIQTPPSENAEEQAKAVDQLAGAGVAGIILSCSDGGKLKSAIDKAWIAAFR